MGLSARSGRHLSHPGAICAVTEVALVPPGDRVAGVGVAGDGPAMLRRAGAGNRLIAQGLDDVPVPAIVFGARIAPGPEPASGRPGEGRRR